MVYPLPVVPTYCSSGWIVYVHKGVKQRRRTGRVGYRTSIKQFPQSSSHTSNTYSNKKANFVGHCTPLFASPNKMPFVLNVLLGTCLKTGSQKLPPGPIRHPTARPYNTQLPMPPRHISSDWVGGVGGLMEVSSKTCAHIGSPQWTNPCMKR